MLKRDLIFDPIKNWFDKLNCGAVTKRKYNQTTANMIPDYPRPYNFCSTPVLSLNLLLSSVSYSNFSYLVNVLINIGATLHNIKYHHLEMRKGEIFNNCLITRNVVYLRNVNRERFNIIFLQNYIFCFSITVSFSPKRKFFCTKYVICSI